MRIALYYQGNATTVRQEFPGLRLTRKTRQHAARDHFLGVTAVSGRGETFKSGGRVVKNVTGYDICKLLAGSWGTLAAILSFIPYAGSAATLIV